MRKVKYFVLPVFLILSVILIGLLATSVLARPASAISPPLGALDQYSVLGGSTVTNTGSTTTSGDLGVSPGSEITGFPPGIIGGAIHIADSNAANAQAANAATFSSLGQACDQTFGAADLSTIFAGGVEPGVYCSTSSFSLSGNLDLIGSGVWIFRTESTLDTSSDSSITGGNPCNVWWQVGSSVTLGTNTSFEGNIFAFVSITLNTGASLNGRALAQTGAVSLDENAIFGPYCVEPPSATDTLIASPTETETGSPTFTQTLTQTATETETQTSTETSTPSSTSQPTLTQTDTLASTPTDQITIVSTVTLTPTLTITVTPTPTLTETIPATESATSSPTDTPTAIPTTTLTVSATFLPTDTLVPTLSETPEDTATASPTTDPATSTTPNTRTVTPTNTVTSSPEITTTTQQTDLPTMTPARSALSAAAVVTPTLLPIVQALPDSGGAPIRNEVLSWILGIIISCCLILIAIRL